VPFIKDRDMYEGKDMMAALDIARTRKPGDRCYVFYHHLMLYWRHDPCWTTAHDLYKEMLKDKSSYDWDDYTAYQLAWQVFFQLHVMPYEFTKREENGDI
jgi:hypothetical protein